MSAKQTKGAGRVHPDGVGWGRMRYDNINLNIMLRGLLPSPDGATFLPEEGLGLVPLKRVYVIIAWLAGE